MPIYEFGPEGKRRRLCVTHLREEPNAGTAFVISKGAACDLCEANRAAPMPEPTRADADAGTRKKK